MIVDSWAETTGAKMKRRSMFQVWNGNWEIRKATARHGEVTIVCKSRKSLRSNWPPSDALILDLEPPEFWGGFRSLKLPWLVICFDSTGKLTHLRGTNFTKDGFHPTASWTVTEALKPTACGEMVRAGFLCDDGCFKGSQWRLCMSGYPGNAGYIRQIPASCCQDDC